MPDENGEAGAARNSDIASTAGAEDIAKAVAAEGYVVLIADVYGQTVRPQNADEALAAMMPLKDDRALLRKRLLVAFEQLQSQGEATVDTSKLAVFGFCFGGCCALDLARTGAPVKAAVSFHGTLDSPNPADAQNIKGSVLIPKGDFLNGSALEKLPSDKQIVMHCKTGVRSAETLAIVKGAGYADAVHVGGGVVAWVNQIDPSQPSY